MGFEPTTPGLKVRSSTAELQAPVFTQNRSLFHQRRQTRRALSIGSSSDPAAQRGLTERVPPYNEPVTKKILVADDEPTLVATLKYDLERDLTQVVTAVDGEAALEVAREIRPDLVLLDLMMPGFSGLEVCRILRCETRDTDPHPDGARRRGRQGRRPRARR